MDDTTRSATPLLAGAALLTGIISLLIVWLLVDLVLGVVVGLVVAALVWFALRRYADRVVLRMVRAVPIGENDAPRLTHVVHSLCLTNGISEPELWLIDDPVPNALITGNDELSAKLVYTNGMIDALDRLELEGVTAHLLSRIASGDMVAGTLAAVVVGIPFGPVPALRARLISSFVPDQVDVIADVRSASLTRYPPGLISALATLSEHGGTLRFPARAARHLWFDDPVDPAGAGRNHTPITERIEMLQEL